MAIKIFYFTGTGNSLAFAREIAKKIEGQLISIVSQMEKETINVSTDVIGTVFPVYYAPPEPIFIFDVPFNPRP